MKCPSCDTEVKTPKYFIRCPNCETPIIRIGEDNPVKFMRHNGKVYHSDGHVSDYVEL